MNKQTGLMFGVAAVMIGGCALFLSLMGNRQHMGEPGVVIVAEPILDPDGNVAGEHSVKLPERVRGYESTAEPVSHIELSWLPADTTYGKRFYSAEDGFHAQLSVVVMGTDRGSIHKPQICLVGQGWNITKTEVASVAISAPHGYELPVMKLNTSIQTKTEAGQPVDYAGVYVYWFVADGQLTPHHGERMWWMARDMITKGVLQRWAYVAYFSVCPPGQEEETFERMKDLIAATVPDFQISAGRSLAWERGEDRKEMAGLEFPEKSGANVPGP
jgi:hypothetical protein